MANYLQQGRPARILLGQPLPNEQGARAQAMRSIVFCAESLGIPRGYYDNNYAEPEVALRPETIQAFEMCRRTSQMPIERLPVVPTLPRKSNTQQTGQTVLYVIAAISLLFFAVRFYKK